MEPYTVFLPVYNEEAILVPNAERLLAHLRSLRAPFEIILGSNGSTDKSRILGEELAGRRPEIRFFHLPAAGPGAAFREATRLMRFDRLVCLDMDLSTDLGFIAEALNLLERCDIIIGSKRMGKDHRSLIRRMGSGLFIFFSKKLLGLPYDDYSLGAKAYRRSLLLEYKDLVDDGTFYVQRIIHRAHRDGRPIAEIPVRCEDFRRSRFNLYKEGLYRFSRLFRLWLASRLPKGALACAACLLLCTAAAAGSISLQTTVEASAGRDGLRVSASVLNRGDEAAGDLRVEMEAPGASWRSSAGASLAPLGSRSYRALLAPKTALPGRYPLFVRLSYADANGYPFSAVSAALFGSGRSEDPSVIASARPLALASRGRLRIGLKNLDDREKSLRLRLALPRELRADPETAEVDILPGQETEAAFAVENVSALEGSVYPAAAAVEYDLDGMHHALLAVAPIRIERRASRAAPAAWLGLAAVILASALVFYNAGSRRKGK